MEAMMDTSYVEIQNTTMPHKVKQALLTQVAATNQSLQVFFEVGQRFFFCISCSFFSFQFKSSHHRENISFAHNVSNVIICCFLHSYTIAGHDRLCQHYLRRRFAVESADVRTAGVQVWPRPHTFLENRPF